MHPVVDPERTKESFLAKSRKNMFVSLENLLEQLKHDALDFISYFWENPWQSLFN